MVSVGISAPDAGPFASEDPVDSEGEFCGMLDPGGGTMALVSKPGEFSNSFD